MPKHLLHIDVGDAIAYVKIHGSPQLTDIQAVIEELLAHPLYRAGMDSLWDLRSANLSNFHPEQLSSLAAFVNPHQERLPRRLAFIAGSDLDHHVLRMWNFFSSDAHPRLRRTFFELNAGRDWLLESREEGRGAPE